MTNSKYSNDLPLAVKNGMSQAEYDTWLFLADKRGLDEEYTYAIKQSDLTEFLREYRTNTIDAAIAALPEKTEETMWNPETQQYQLPDAYAAGKNDTIDQMEAALLKLKKG